MRCRGRGAEETWEARVVLALGDARAGAGENETEEGVVDPVGTDEVRLLAHHRGGELRAGGGVEQDRRAALRGIALEHRRRDAAARRLEEKRRAYRGRTGCARMSLQRRTGRVEGIDGDRCTVGLYRDLDSSRCDASGRQP